MTELEAKIECNKRGYYSGVTIDKSVFNYSSYQKIWTIKGDTVKVYNDGTIRYGGEFVFKDGTWARIINENNNNYPIY